jgi:hypothetical protein
MISAWMVGTALCGAVIALAGLMYGRTTHITVGSAIAVGALLPGLPWPTLLS